MSSQEMDTTKDETNNENAENTIEFSTPDDKQQTLSTWVDDAKEDTEHVVQIPDVIALLY